MCVLCVCVLGWIPSAAFSRHAAVISPHPEIYHSSRTLAQCPLHVLTIIKNKNNDKDDDDEEQSFDDYFEFYTIL